jgi:hypothetical protein
LLTTSAFPTENSAAEYGGFHDEDERVEEESLDDTRGRAPDSITDMDGIGEQHEDDRNSESGQTDKGEDARTARGKDKQVDEDLDERQEGDDGDGDGDSDDVPVGLCFF